MIEVKECKNCANKEFCGKRAGYCADLEVLTLGVKSDATQVNVTCKYYRKDEVKRDTL